MAAMETIPPEALLADYPGPMRRLADELRALVRDELPDAVERVRIGWRLIAYDLPLAKRRTVFCCYVAPEPKHVHIGFQYGVFMRDDEGVLEGAGVTKQVRWLTFRAGDTIDEAQVGALVREGARVARLTRGERLISVLERDSMSSVMEVR